MRRRRTDWLVVNQFAVTEEAAVKTVLMQAELLCGEWMDRV